VSFEYVSWAPDHVRACVGRLEALGDYRVAWSPGESYRLASGAWLTGDRVCARLEAAVELQSGDVYACRSDVAATIPLGVPPQS